MEAAVLGGRAVHDLVEDFSEVAGGPESAVAGNLRDGFTGAAQGVGGHARPVLQQIGERRGVQGLAEASQAFPLADAGGGGDLSQGQFFLIVGLDEQHHFLRPFFSQVDGHLS